MMLCTSDWRLAILCSITKSPKLIKCTAKPVLPWCEAPSLKVVAKWIV